MLVTVVARQGRQEGCRGANVARLNMCQDNSIFRSLVKPNSISKFCVAEQFQGENDLLRKDPINLSAVLFGLRRFIITTSGIHYTYLKDRRPMTLVPGYCMKFQSGRAYQSFKISKSLLVPPLVGFIIP